jgi:hypothetical protein
LIVHPDHAEMIQHKENGLLVANQDVENFAEAPNL